MKAKDLARYTPEQIKALCIQYWNDRKKERKRCTELEQEIERLKVEIELRDVVISDVRDALEGRR